MTFTISEIALLAVLLSGIISMIITTAILRPVIRSATGQPESTLPTFGKAATAAAGILIVNAFAFYLMLDFDVLFMSSAIFLTIVCIAIVSFSLYRGYRYLHKCHPDIRLNLTNISRKLTKAQYSLMQVPFIMIFAPPMIYMGTVNLLIYTLPDITTVEKIKSGYSHTRTYGWPKGEDTGLTKSYIHNLTHDTLYIANVLYAIPGENDYNEYNVSRPFPPGSFTEAARPPQYVMMPIPEIRRYAMSKMGPHRRFSSYLVSAKMLRQFSNARMNIYGLFPNSRNLNGLPRRSTVTDNDRIYDYQNRIREKLMRAGVDLNSRQPYIDCLPSFPGGRKRMEKFIAHHLHYPAFARDLGLEGTVVVGAVVATDGKLSDIAIEVSVSPSLDEEAVRIVKEMPRWNPGILYTKEAPCRISIPIRFRLQQ